MAQNSSEPLPSQERFLISDLCALLELYLPDTQVREVYRAYLFSAEAHEGQKRKSGEPYIYHPVEVARILGNMHMDAASLIAAILHDVVEDTLVSLDTIKEQFGEDIAGLVDGVSKLTQIKFESRAEAQAENFCKMMLAMVKDIRVIMVKLADRLHNMRTLGVMPAEKQRRIARETLDIYAPIANRLGMNKIRLELEELGFVAYYPLRYRVLKKAINKLRGNRKTVLQKIESNLTSRLEQESFTFRLLSREKHLYSLYKKIRDRVGSFSEVYDVYAFRIIVDNVDTCYRVLGAMHNLYKPVPGKFKDYIAIPKSNGYQSLHTVLFGPYGVPIEVQIRTLDMNRVAESGIAAHWSYKHGESGHNKSEMRAREWLRQLLEIQQTAGDSQEFLESVKIDLFPDEVYVFTPAGKILELPRNATVVDFAYAVHTDIGNTCIAAKVDRRLAPLRTSLLNGQTVEIITANGAHPNPAWLNFVSTAKARTNIRHYLKNLQQDEAISLGERMLDRALHTHSITLKDVDVQPLQQLLEECGFESPYQLYADIGLGKRMATLVARRLVPVQSDVSEQATGSDRSPLVIRGTEGMVVHFARCCWPIPNDAIVGFISAGRGLVIHREGCKNLSEIHDRPDKWIDVAWASDLDREFPVELQVDVSNRRGMLASIATAISREDANIENVSIDERVGLDSRMNFTVAVTSRTHLARVIRGINHIPSVIRVIRTKQ
ncbi:MAG: bifunctional (p)ppGpp synthetase/guanosine-3',5'-bis(diphosphate) 3'-pyrophosphohydrolase [Gammaproteobacteria bacterium]